jgi:hypothetical protein
MLVGPETLAFWPRGYNGFSEFSGRRNCNDSDDFSGLKIVAIPATPTTVKIGPKIVAIGCRNQGRQHRRFHPQNRTSGPHDRCHYNFPQSV